MSKPKLSSLLKPTVDTPFQIDFDWWKEHDRSWRVHLRSCLCEEHQEMYADLSGDEKVDWIDPETAEVQSCGWTAAYFDLPLRQTGAVHHRTYHPDRSPLPDFPVQWQSTPLTRGVGRKSWTGRLIILQTISGPRVYKGIRPAPKNLGRSRIK